MNFSSKQHDSVVECLCCFVAKMIMIEEGGIRALEADHEELSS
jgi:hypothetical protein